MASKRNRMIAGFLSRIFFYGASPLLTSTMAMRGYKCIAEFLHPQHNTQQVRKVLEDVAVIRPYLYFDDLVAMLGREEPWGTQKALSRESISGLEAGWLFRFITT